MITTPTQPHLNLTSTQVWFDQGVTPGVTEISVSPGNLPRSHLFSNPGIPSWTICVKETNLVPEPRRTICLMFDSRRESEADSCLISSEIVLLEPQICRQYCRQLSVFSNPVSQSQPGRCDDRNSAQKMACREEYGIAFSCVAGYR